MLSPLHLKLEVEGSVAICTPTLGVGRKYIIKIEMSTLCHEFSKKIYIDLKID